MKQSVQDFVNGKAFRHFSKEPTAYRVGDPRVSPGKISSNQLHHNRRRKLPRRRRRKNCVASTNQSNLASVVNASSRRRRGPRGLWYCEFAMAFNTLKVVFWKT